jgi:predicted nucleic acid-binding protein
VDCFLRRPRRHLSSRPHSRLVVHTMVVSWLLTPSRPQKALEYRSLVGDSTVVLSFQTVMEMRYGAYSARWGELRLRQLERDLGQFSVAQPDDETILLCARFRADCRRQGHALGDKVHDGDRWIAATALRLGCPLVSDDRLYRGAPGLALLTLGD